MRGLMAMGCSENVYEGTSRAGVCGVGTELPVWPILVLAPALAVFAVVLRLKGRARWASVAAILVTAATIEVILSSIATSNLLASIVLWVLRPHA